MQIEKKQPFASNKLHLEKSIDDWATWREKMGNFGSSLPGNVGV